MVLGSAVQDRDGEVNRGLGGMAMFKIRVPESPSCICSCFLSSFLPLLLLFCWAFLFCFVFIVNLTQVRLIFIEDFLIEKRPPSDWPVGKSVGHFLD